MIILSKRFLYVVCLVFAALFSIGFVITKAALKENEIIVIVDAGHGEPDGGAVGVTGVLEKDVNLQIALKTAEVLEAKGFNALMTRTGDSGIFDENCETIRQKKKSDMQERLRIMTESDADLFLSIHMNSFENSSAQGLNVFYTEEFPEIKPLAESIQRRISDITGADTHNVKFADNKLYLMKNPPVPAILTECGFLSNPDEEKKLVTEDYQSRIAWAIAEAVEDYYK